MYESFKKRRGWQLGDCVLKVFKGVPKIFIELSNLNSKEFQHEALDSKYVKIQGFPSSKYLLKSLLI